MSWGCVSIRWWMAVAILSCSHAVMAQTPVPTAPTTPSDSIQQLQHARLEALKESQQKDVEALRAQIAAVDRRVDDWNTQVRQGVDRLGVYASVFGTLVTVLLAGLGLLGFITVSRRTKAEAQDAAKEWFQQNAATLETRLNQIEDQARQTQDQMAASAQSVVEHAVGVKKQQDEALAKAMAHVQGMMGKEASAPATPENQAAVEIVRERAEALKKNPEDSYSFDDWNTRALAAYKSNQLEEAALLWLKASEVPNAGALKVAQVLFNRGVAQGRLGQSGAAIATYDEVIRHFGEAPEATVREQVVNAHNGIGFRRICDGKALLRTSPPDAQALWQDALAHFDQALSKLEPNRLNGLILGNCAYALALLGYAAQAESLFAQALRAPVDGARGFMTGTCRTSTYIRFQKTRTCVIWSSASGASGKKSRAKSNRPLRPRHKSSHFFAP